METANAAQSINQSSALQNNPRQEFTRTPRPDTHLTGIIDDPATILKRIENGWQEKIDGKYTAVLAGAEEADPQQGMLVVWPANQEREYYLTPRKSGAVKIIAFEGFQLTLQSADGELFFFDVPGRVFIDAIGDIVPTASPVATTEPPLKMNISTPVPAYP
jgi:hypothetical protein